MLVLKLAGDVQFIGITVLSFEEAIANMCHGHLTFLVPMGDVISY